jgi:hypothetical protein
MGVGQLHAFTATVSGGTSPYSYQWYLNGTAVPNATGVTWTFAPLSSGSYTIYVKVTDAAGAIAPSNIAAVTVSAAPSVRILPCSVTLGVGQFQTFRSRVSGGTPPYSYQWYLNGTPVSGVIDSSWTCMFTSAGSCTVYLVVTDAANVTATSNTATITVTDATSENTITEGHTISVCIPLKNKGNSPETFTCEVTLRETFNGSTWSINAFANATLPAGNTTILTINVDFDSAGSYTLSIDVSSTNVNLNYTGTVVVVAPRTRPTPI